MCGIQSYFSFYSLYSNLFKFDSFWHRNFVYFDFVWIVSHHLQTMHLNHLSFYHLSITYGTIYLSICCFGGPTDSNILLTDKDEKRCVFIFILIGFHIHLKIMKNHWFWNASKYYSHMKFVTHLIWPSSYESLYNNRPTHKHSKVKWSSPLVNVIFSTSSLVIFLLISSCFFFFFYIASFGHSISFIFDTMKCFHNFQIRLVVVVVVFYFWMTTIGPCEALTEKIPTKTT